MYSSNDEGEGGLQMYEYPLNDSWSTQEIVTVVNLLSAVETAYEKGIELAKFQQYYQAFKQVVTSIGEEKRIDKSFAQASGYSLYRVVTQMKQLQTGNNAKRKQIIKL